MWICRGVRCGACLPAGACAPLSRLPAASSAAPLPLIYALSPLRFIIKTAHVVFVLPARPPTHCAAACLSWFCAPGRAWLQPSARPAQRQQVLKEVAVMRLLGRQGCDAAPHVPRLLAVFEDECRYVLVMELCAGGELFDRILTQVCVCVPPDGRGGKRW